MPVAPSDRFLDRHLGPSSADQAEMLGLVGASSLEALMDATVPEHLRYRGLMTGLPAPMTEREAIDALAERAGQNRVLRSYLGHGFHDTITPPVILRNILENPGWYTAYTPYQAEISQGRLEAVLVYQTMVQDLTGLEIANASLLDEATGAAEAMAMSHRLVEGGRNRFLVDRGVHPANLAVVQTRAHWLGISVEVVDLATAEVDDRCFGVLLQYPATDGSIRDWSEACARAHAAGALVTAATDLLALTQLRSPGSFGVDIAVGNSQRFGVPLGYGGPHAAFMATRMSYQRQMPGRIIGQSKDAQGNPALRMALQTREQHIRRQKATSNICTAQVLLAVCAGMYAVWHGPDGLRRISARVAGFARALAHGLASSGHSLASDAYFDTLCVQVGDRQRALVDAALARGINLRAHGTDALIVALDETVRPADLADLFAVFGVQVSVEAAMAAAEVDFGGLSRGGEILSQPVFRSHHTEHEMLRYLHRLESRDLALNTSMIPLGSCTMKLNATTEMIPVTWRGFGGIHPFAPPDQAQGYARLFDELERWIAEVTGFDAVSLQPNAGSQGEYAGLMAIRGYHAARGEGQRDICLIPSSAHGTNPASAVMLGLEVVVVDCDAQGNIQVSDLEAKAALYASRLAALMVTYPSTHGVFEEAIDHITAVVHAHGGQVYMDGANLNAMVGVIRPRDIGADVCHLNLHKTFCIPHGGGGPGMGPIAVRAHLAPHLPGHPLVDPSGAGPARVGGAVSAAPWGSSSILPISWAYIAMCGFEGLRRSTEVAILNANYIAKRVCGSFPVLYSVKNGFNAHECIFDLRPLKQWVAVDDVAKRLMDYGFHAPTMSFPVVGTLMIEPTESESKGELDRLCDALIAIRAEIEAIATGAADPNDNPLKHAPHTAAVVCGDSWEHAYPRSQAAFPAPWTRIHKYWPFVGRVDNAYGDRNLICTCDAWPES